MRWLTLAVHQKNNATLPPSLLITPFPQGKMRLAKSQEVLLLLPMGEGEAAFLCVLRQATSVS